MGTPKVLFTMNRKGGDLMGKLTGENVGRRMAIVLDEKISSAPVIQSQINERGGITLGAAIDPVALQQEAKDLVAVLRSGSLPAPLTKTFETQVGKTLGDDAVDRAMLSMYVGAAAVVLFMLIYYKLAGLIAIIAMLLNLLFMVAILAAFEAALTLPGIAGLVLTIGMAVDANIIIYERIREELRAGQISAQRGGRRVRPGVLDGVRRPRHHLRRRRGAVLLRLRSHPGLRRDPAGGHHQ